MILPACTVVFNGVRFHFPEQVVGSQTGKANGIVTEEDAEFERARQMLVKALERLKTILARQGMLWAEEFSTAHSCGCC